MVTHYGRNGVFAQGHVEVAATQEPDLALPLLPNMVDVAVLHKVSVLLQKLKVATLRSVQVSIYRVEFRILLPGIEELLKKSKSHYQIPH